MSKAWYFTLGWQFAAGWVSVIARFVPTLGTDGWWIPFAVAAGMILYALGRRSASPTPEAPHG